MDKTMKENCSYKKKESNGFTLIEVLVAMAVLTIIVVCFTFVYGWSFENTFLMGDKSKAIAKAQETIERLYINIDDENVGLKKVTNPSELYIYNETDPGNYYIEDNITYTIEGKEVEGYRVTAVVFYKSGERYAKITTLIAKDTLVG